MQCSWVASNGYRATRSEVDALVTRVGCPRRELTAYSANAEEAVGIAEPQRLDDEKGADDGQHDR
jgi:hypothetical protein